MNFENPDKVLEELYTTLRETVEDRLVKAAHLQSSTEESFDEEKISDDDQDY